jgi:[acyl-carrier-protein] S-malonyltransferase
VAAVCEETPGFVEPVNFNLPNQTVISGEATAATAAADNLAQRGARTVRLGVSSAFHTKMMAGAAARFSAEIADISFSQPKTAFYSNLTGDKLDITDYPAYFARHMVSPVRFVDQVSAMARDGLDTVVEFGPGKTGSGLVKKNNRAFTVFNVEDGAGFEKLRERFGS